MIQRTTEDNLRCIGEPFQKIQYDDGGFGPFGRKATTKGQ